MINYNSKKKNYNCQVEILLTIQRIVRMCRTVILNMINSNIKIYFLNTGILSPFFNGKNGGVIISKKNPDVNERIRDREIRLISEDGEQLGVMETAAAVDLAFSKGLDLIKVAPGAKPPVCKIMDYGKYKYELAKKEKRAKKNSSTVETKEMRLSVKIQDHDLQTKANKVKGFIEDGNNVKISLRFRGREMGHKKLGFDVVEKFIEFVGKDICNVSKRAKFEGRNITAYIEPKRQ